MSQLPPEQHPPKPRLTLRVGITGHRPNKLKGDDVLLVASRLDDVMKAIDRVVATIYAENADFYADGPQSDAPATDKPYRVRLVSGFAEGADQMAVAAAPKEWIVEAILPFPKDEYRKDFLKSAAGDERDVTGELDASLRRAQVIAELPAPNPQRRNHGYVLAGGYLLRQVDLLIAVWDGEEPKPGGTGAIVEEARDGGIPVIWIPVEAATRIRFIETFEDDKPVPADKDWSDAALKDLLKPLLDAPSNKDEGRRRSPREGLSRIYREVWLPECHMRQYDVFSRWIGRRRPFFRRLAAPDFAREATAFHDFVGEATPLEPLRPRLRDILAPRHVWADALAVHFSHCYRSAYLLSYSLAAVAVFIALLGIFLPHHSILFPYDYLVVKGVLVALELFVIFQVLHLVRHGRRHFWHERWLEYRVVAEGIRHGRFLACVSEFGQSQHDRTAPQAWTIWYLRATMREIGLPAANLGEAYQQAALDQTLIHEIAGQIDYHHRTAHMMERIEHFLHGWGLFCFRATIVILSVFAILLIGALLGLYVPAVGDLYRQHLPFLYFEGKLEPILDVSKLLVVLFAAGLPAVGAALAGIGVQGDFEGARERSERTEAELKALKQACEEARRNPRLERTAETLIDTARVLSEDLAAWQELYGRKRLNLPS
jgi:hypothetical protein